MQATNPSRQISVHMLQLYVGYAKLTTCAPASIHAQLHHKVTQHHNNNHISQPLPAFPRVPFPSFHSTSHITRRRLHASVPTIQRNEPFTNERTNELTNERTNEPATDAIHRTSNIEHRTSNIDRQTSIVKRRTSNVERRTNNDGLTANTAVSQSVTQSLSQPTASSHLSE